MNHFAKKVLIVDDEEDLTWTLTRKLSRDNNMFEVLAVNSGKDALELLDRFPVDMVVTDVRMPEVSGLELLVKIREKHPFTKVIIMTAYGSSEVQAEANNRGCFQYIEKPFEINDLKHIIVEGLDEKEGFKGNVSDFDLSDLIQLNCLGRLNITLIVKHQNEEGTIYFRDGNIIHAEKDNLVGEEAFNHIMNWKNGEFSVKKNNSIPKTTIFSSWQSLILESMRRAREDLPLEKDDEEQEKYWRFRKLESFLKPIKNSEGVLHIIIHSRIGLPIYYMGRFNNEEDSISELSNEISSFLRGFEKGTMVLNNQPVEFLEIQLEEQTIFIYKMPYQDTFLSIIGNKRLNAGFVRFEIKKILYQIAQLIQ